MPGDLDEQKKAGKDEEKTSISIAFEAKEQNESTLDDADRELVSITEKQRPQKTGQVHILTQLKESNPEFKKNYQQVITEYNTIFGTVHPESYYEENGGYYDDLLALQQRLLMFVDNNLNPTYRQAGMYFEKVSNAMIEFQRTHYKGIFVLEELNAVDELNRYVYQCRIGGQVVAIPICLDVEPRNLDERFKLAESLRLCREFHGSNWGVENNRDIWVLALKLYKETSALGHPTAAKTDILHIRSLKNEEIKLWVKVKPKTATEFFALATDIIKANRPEGMKGNVHVAEKFWLMSHSTVEDTVMYLLTYAKEKGCKQAGMMLDNIKQLQDEQAKENNRQLANRASGPSGI